MLACVCVSVCVYFNVIPLVENCTKSYTYFFFLCFVFLSVFFLWMQADLTQILEAVSVRGGDMFFLVVNMVEQNRDYALLRRRVIRAAICD